MVKLTPFFIMALSAITISGCSTYVPQRYSLSADSNQALKSIKTGAVSVGEFSGPKEFDQNCRAAGSIEPPDGMTYEAYVRKALVDELKVSGILNENGKNVISGRLNSLEFSSSKGLTNGVWKIDLTLSSSNGKTMTVQESYEFKSGFDAGTACKQTADAFMPAVQNLVLTIVSSPDFKHLVK